MSLSEPGEGDLRPDTVPIYRINVGSAMSQKQRGTRRHCESPYLNAYESGEAKYGKQVGAHRSPRPRHLGLHDPAVRDVRDGVQNA